LDTWIDMVDIEEARRAIERFIRRGVPQQIVTVNLDFLRLSVHNRTFRDIVNASSLVIADGMPLVWASRLQGEPLPQRIAGVDLVMECARLSAGQGYRLFLLGAAPGVADSAAQVMRRRYPDVQIAGTYSPPSLSADDNATTLALVREARPDILLVAFGAPRQETWIQQHMQTLGIPVCMGVGGSFDLISGRLSRAPEWMRRGGMEWFYRFSLEPKRLWKRYFVQDLPILIRLISWSTAPTMRPMLPRQLPTRSVLAGEVATRAVHIQ
jgi:N-acetylglucosaminyldiphosphoundecaprenol N-acetyl-beta-D-mannosaminyltransferase